MKRKFEEISSKDEDEPEHKKRKKSKVSMLYSKLIRDSEMSEDKHATFIIATNCNCDERYYLIYNKYNLAMLELFKMKKLTDGCTVIREQCYLDEKELCALKILSANEKVNIIIDYDDYSLIYDHLHNKYDLNFRYKAASDKKKIPLENIEKIDADLIKYTYEEMFGFVHGIYD